MTVCIAAGDESRVLTVDDEYCRKGVHRQNAAQLCFTVDGRRSTVDDEYSHKGVQAVNAVSTNVRRLSD